MARVKGTDINPDADISVASVCIDGTLMISTACSKLSGKRSKLFTTKFPSYGAAVLHAVEYDKRQRKLVQERQT